MRKAENSVVKEICEYLRQDVGHCVYVYIDIAKYGLDNPNMSVWYDRDQEGDLNLVVMKYYDSISVYSRSRDWDIKPVCELIKKEQVGMVSGQSWIIEMLYPVCGDNYDLEIGYEFQLTNFREFPDIAHIEEGTIGDTLEIAKLICSDQSIGGYYEIENLAGQLAERIETGIGRSLVIRNKEGKIIAHIATYAEFDKIATTAGLIAQADGSNIPYGTLLESRLVNDLLAEGFEIYTFVTEERRARFFRTMKCKELSRYGKMTIRER